MLFPPRLTIALTVLLAARTASALVIVGDSSANSTAPANDFGFENVADVFEESNGTPASGVYLGNGWMISAYHVVADSAADGGFSFGGVVLDGVGYTVDPATAVRLVNSNQSPTDLAVFRLTTVPVGLPSVKISGSDPAAGTSVDMAGNGYTGASSLTHWNVNTATTPWTWTTVASGGNYQGYSWVDTNQIQWGINTIYQYQGATDDGHGTTNLVLTKFNTAINLDAQGADGDSGGGLFYQANGTWELGGIFLGVTGPLSGQPNDTSVSGAEGQYTAFADLTSYQAQIEAIIPEPSTGILGGVGMLILTRRRRKMMPAR